MEEAIMETLGTRTMSYAELRQALKPRRMMAQFKALVECEKIVPVNDHRKSLGQGVWEPHDDMTVKVKCAVANTMSRQEAYQYGKSKLAEVCEALANLPKDNGRKVMQKLKADLERAVIYCQTENTNTKRCIQFIETVIRELK